MITLTIHDYGDAYLKDDLRFKPTKSPFQFEIEVEKKGDILEFSEEYDIMFTKNNTIFFDGLGKRFKQR